MGGFPQRSGQKTSLAAVCHQVYGVAAREGSPASPGHMTVLSQVPEQFRSELTQLGVEMVGRWAPLRRPEGCVTFVSTTVFPLLSWVY